MQTNAAAAKPHRVAVYYNRAAAEAHADRIGGEAYPMGFGRWDIYKDAWSRASTA